MLSNITNKAAGEAPNLFNLNKGSDLKKVPVLKNKRVSVSCKENPDVNNNPGSTSFVNKISKTKKTFNDNQKRTANHGPKNPIFMLKPDTMWAQVGSATDEACRWDSADNVLANHDLDSDDEEMAYLMQNSLSFKERVEAQQAPSAKKRRMDDSP